MIEVQPELLVRWSGGSINLMGWNDSPHGDYLIETLAEGTDWGNIESVRRTLRSAIRDGSRTTKERDDNRRIALKLRVSAPFHSALAAGEQELDLIDGRRCELVWTPPTVLGVAPSVFVVDYADLTHEMDDLGYERGELYYQLTLSCLPHAYADSWITVPAVVQGPSIPVTVDTVDTCDSTAGWSVSGGTMSAPAGKGALDFLLTGGARGMTATRTGPVDLSTDRFLAAWGDRPTRLEVLNGTTWTVLPQVAMDDNYYVYNGTGLADPTVDALRFVWAVPDMRPTTRTLFDIRKQSAQWSTASRQQLRAVEVPGSRRTPASVLVESPTAGLGTVLAYGGPQYNPALSRGALQARSGASSTLSGSQGRLDSGAVLSFEVPAADYYSGSHSMFVVARPTAGGVTTVGTIDTTVKLMNSSGVTVTSTYRSQKFTYGAGEVKVALLGAVDLPGAALPENSSTYVRVELGWAKDPAYASSDERDLWVDEVLFFNRTLGRLLIGNAGGNRKVWIDAANLDRDHDVVFAGSGPKSDASPLSLASELPAWTGALTMTPGTTYLYVGTTGASDSTVEATFRPAGNTHMPALGA